MANVEDPFKKGQDFLQIVSKAKEFTEELLKENERLRFKVAALETSGASAGSEERIRELTTRLRELEERLAELEARHRKVEEENKEFADRYIEIEEQNNNLANLYVASYQLHSTLDFKEVVRIVQEIVINLIGAEVFAVYMLDGRGEELQVVAAEGVDASRIPGCRLGAGPLGKAVTSTETTCWDTARSTDFTRPIVCIPLQIQRRPIGAIAIFSLLQQKDGFSALDHELFNLLGGHAATAIFAAKLYSQSARKLNTIQGFIDLLTK
jgi:nitrate/nitrite-specific signal transduction histidine kinase